MLSKSVSDFDPYRMVDENGGAAMSESKFETEVRKAIKIAIRCAGARQR
jgi:hypothetical protein